MNSWVEQTITHRMEPLRPPSQPPAQEGPHRLNWPCLKPPCPRCPRIQSKTRLSHPPRCPAMGRTVLFSSLWRWLALRQRSCVMEKTLRVGRRNGSLCYSNSAVTCYRTMSRVVTHHTLSTNIIAKLYPTYS